MRRLPPQKSSADDDGRPLLLHNVVLATRGRVGGSTHGRDGASLSFVRRRKIHRRYPRIIGSSEVESLETCPECLLEYVAFA